MSAKIGIRMDASEEIGAGHFSRCANLAEGFQKKGADVFFIMRKLPGGYETNIEKRGFKTLLIDPPSDDLEQDFEATYQVVEDNDIQCDWLVVDHYGLDERWESRARDFSEKILVIDDLANRAHDCDILLDQNLVQNMEGRYSRLVPNGTKILLGPKFALLKAEFEKVRSKTKFRNGPIRNIHLFFGGSDSSNETMKAVNAIKASELEEPHVTVVVGSSNPQKNEIEKFCSENKNMKFFCQTNDMATLMAQADLGIGGAGVASWERCCVGLPSLSISVVSHQEPIGEELHRQGATQYLGRFNEVPSQKISDEINQLLKNPSKFQGLSQTGMQLVDGQGVRRTIEAMGIN